MKKHKEREHVGKIAAGAPVVSAVIKAMKI